MSQKTAAPQTAPKASASNSSPPKFVRAKLRVSEASDATEQEADRAAERAVNGESSKRLMRTEQPGAGGSPISPDAEAHIHAADQAGSRSLERNERDFFESRMGYDFSNVRIRDGAAAHRAAEGIGARAFTIGRNIYFGAGQYDASSNRGRHLMAHELAHTIQQSSTVARMPLIQRQEEPGGTTALQTKSYTVHIGGTPAARGNLRVLKQDDQYRDGSEAAHAIGAGGRVENVTVAPTDRIVVQAFDAQGKVYGTSAAASAGIIRIPAVSTGPGARQPQIVRAQRTYKKGGKFVTETITPSRFADASNYDSTGSFGMIEIWLDPPAQTGNQVTSFILQDEDPSETYHVLAARGVTPGNTPASADTFPIANITEATSKQPIRGGESTRAGGANYIVIKHTGGADSVPGVDIKTITFPKEERTQIDQITVLVDMSGSMFRDVKTGEESESQANRIPTGTDAAQIENRLYQRAAAAVREELLPRRFAPGVDIRVVFKAFFQGSSGGLISFDTGFNTDTSVTNIGELTRARLAARLLECLDAEATEGTPLKSAILDSIKEANTTAEGDTRERQNHALIVLTDGVGGRGGESVKDLTSAMTQAANNLNVGKRGFFELLGFRVPHGEAGRKERGEVLSFQAPGPWATSSYDLRTTSELRGVLRGLRTKFGLTEGSSPTQTGTPEGPIIGRNIPGTNEPTCAQIRSNLDNFTFGEKKD